MKVAVRALLAAPSVWLPDAPHCAQLRNLSDTCFRHSTQTIGPRHAFI